MLTVPGIVLAAVFRAIGLPGGKGAAAVTGGLLAGVLMGSLVLGSAMPDLHGPIVEGAIAERAEYESARRDRDAELAAALAAIRETGVSEVAERELVADVNERYESRIEAARESLRDAEEEHRRRLSGLLGVLAGLVFASGYFRRTRREISEDAQIGRSAGRRLPRVFGPFPPTPVELLMLVMAAAPAAILARWLLGVDIPVALAFGIVLAMPGSTVRRGGQEFSGGWVFLIGALLVSICATMAWGAGIGSTVLIGTAMVFSLLLLTIDNTFLRTRRSEIRFHDAVFYALLLPALAGALGTIVDLGTLVSTGGFWIALVIGLIASGDGRWFGYALAIRYFADEPANRTPSSHANAAISAGAPMLQLVLAVLAFRAEPVAGSLIFAALAGAMVLELSRNLRSRIARQFDEILSSDRESAS